MKTVVPLLVLVFLGCQSACCEEDPSRSLNGENCGRSSIQTSDRIVGGERARHGRYPWVVAVYGREASWGYNGDFEFRCAGAILNNRWIVTAASCFTATKDYWKLLIRSGLYKISEEDGPTVKYHKVSKVVIHPDYSTYYSYKNNIALIRLRDPIDFSASRGYANAICVPEDDEEPAGFATVVGWGQTEEKAGFDPTDVLMEAMLPIIPAVKCGNNYGNNICAGIKGKNICYKDSGDPLFQMDYRGRSVLIGIAATQFRCAFDDLPGEFSRISMYRDWILEVIRE